jgi:hypothetical protein
VVKVMRDVCLQTYPDKKHYYNLNYMCVDAHAARVMAAVAFSNAGISKEEIAFRLRWKPESVDHYLRDCSHTSCKLTTAALQGSFSILKKKKN